MLQDFRSGTPFIYRVHYSYRDRDQQQIDNFSGNLNHILVVFLSEKSDEVYFLHLYFLGLIRDFFQLLQVLLLSEEVEL